MTEPETPVPCPSCPQRTAGGRHPARAPGVAVLLVLLVALLGWPPAGAQTGAPAAPETGRGEGAAEGGLRGVVPRQPGRPADESAAEDGTAGPAAGREETGGAAAAAAVPAAGAGSPGSLAGGVRVPAEAGAAAGGTEALRALAEVLRDDEARARLLAELDRITQPGAAGGAAGPAVATGGVTGGGTGGGTGGDAVGRPAEEEPRTIGRRLGETTQEAAEDIARTLVDVRNGLAATLRRLRGLARLDAGEIEEIGSRLGFVVLVTVGLFVALRLVARSIFRMLGASAAAGGHIQRVIAYVVSVCVDVLAVVLAWAAGYAIAMFALEPRMQIGLLQTFYLNAFLAVEMVKVVLRAFLAPSDGRLRPLPIGGRTANYWSWWGSVLASVLGYGLMLVVPVIAEYTSVFTGRAIAVMLFAVVLLTAMVLVVVHRHDLPRAIDARLEADPGDVTLQGLALLARVAWLGMIVWLGFLFVYAVTQTGNVGPFVFDTLKVVAALAAALLAGAALERFGERGVRLSARMREKLPLLEARLNGFLPMFLRFVRFAIFLSVLSYAVHVIGLADLAGWLDRMFGVDVVATMVSVGFIVLFSFAAWLALTSWIDYRLTPANGRAVTSRERTLLSLFRNAATIAIVTITLMFALSEMGIDIAPLIASAGVIGLAIGFGAQKLVQDIITGVFIQFENAINVGDVVTAGGTTGVVEKLTIRSVSLRDLEGVFHVIPFSSVDSVSNFMRGFAYHVADLGIAYRENTDDGKAAMLECYEELRADPDFRYKVVGDLEWFGVQSLGDSAVVLRARIKCTPGNQWAVGRRYNELLKKACDRKGIEIPFPHMTVWFGVGRDGGAPPANLRVLERRTIEGEAAEAGTAAPSGGARPTTDLPDDDAGKIPDDAPR